MKTLLAGIALAGVTTLGMSHAALAQVRLGINVGVPAPAYVAPAPVYAAPPVEYRGPPVVYAAPPPAYAPPPVYVAPAPVYAPIAIGWYGDRYYDGHRYWNRDDWYRYHGRGDRHWR